LIYVETSVVLAFLFAEDRVPPDSFWNETLVSSRLTEYEISSRLHARRADKSRLEEAHVLLGKVALSDLSTPILARALEPFPLPVRTLDALHLASFHFISSMDPKLALATYDQRLLDAAREMNFRLYPL